MSVEKFSASFAPFGFSIPLPAVGHVFSGFEYLGVILVTAIPFGIYDLVEALDNVESAPTAGDTFPTTRVWFGVISLISTIIPVIAISPILLYIGMLIGAQAFQETPRAHAPAIVLALTPNLAAWGKLLIDNALPSSLASSP